MSGNKRYYWLKLDENFFEDDTIQWLEEQKNGKNYVIFYLKLMLKSLKDDGSLVRYVGERLIPYDVPALARLTGTNEDTVAVAMKTFLDIGLISQFDSGEIYMNQINEMIGSETDSARRMRKKRVRDAKEQKKLAEPSHCDNNVQECDSDVHKSDTEIELEIDKDIDKETTTTENKARKNSSGGKLPSKNVFGTWEELWMFPNLVQKEILVELSEKYSDELVVAAIKVAGANDVIKGRAINFIEAVLKEWEDNNVKTIEQAREYTKKRNKGKSNRNYNKQSRKQESLPDWESSTQDDEIVEDESMKERLARIREMREAND